MTDFFDRYLVGGSGKLRSASNREQDVVGGTTSALNGHCCRGTAANADPGGLPPSDHDLTLGVTMTLSEEISAAKRSVRTDTVQITFGEVAVMYGDGELNISPEFQRLFRWSEDRKSNFIESILIGIPVPPVFVFEKSDGTWELVDGLQRISTVLEFMGLLKNPEAAVATPPVLVKTKYLPSLDGVAWDRDRAQSF